MSSREIVFAAAGAGGDVNYVEDVFSTWLYTGTSASQTITNDIDLAGEGGLVWIKSRDTTFTHYLADTVGGTSNYLRTTSTDGYETGVTTRITSFNSDGFSLGSAGSVNNSGSTFASWTFREQPKFFDVVTYTGNGASGGRTISHNLGSAPGMIILKVTNLAGDDWYVYHRSIPTRVLALNSANATDPTPPQFVFGNGSTVVAPTSTNFTIGSTVNPNGYNYIAYLFAHDAGGFGETGTDNVISCGSFTTDSTGGYSVTLGYEAQYVLLKRTNGTGDWLLLDVMRGAAVSADSSRRLRANLTAVESTDFVLMSPKADGFYADSSLSNLSGSSNYIYMAIRRPMKVPTTGTSVFSPIASTASQGTKITTNFTIDSQWVSWRPGLTGNAYVSDRLRGNSTTTTSSGLVLNTSNSGAENSVDSTQGWDNTGFQISSNWSGGNVIYWSFRRASGFFDQVCYTGQGTFGPTNHNLGVKPELVIYKRRNASASWEVVAPIDSVSYYNGILNTTAALTYNPSDAFIASQYTATEFCRYADSGTIVAYLFATCAGVSKVGFYTGNGSTQAIACGFTGGARFVLIKRTDSTGNWWVWDTARGMVAGTDPRLALNSTAAELNNDWVDTITGGFQIVTTDATVNASGGSYIFLAIA